MGSLPIFAPVLWLSGNPLLATNVLVVASLWLSALGAYLLTRHLIGSTGAGLLAGMIFGFAPYRFAQFAHVQLLATQWMPFTLLALHLAVTRRQWRYFLAFALFFTLQALSTFYYALFMGVVVGLFVVVYVVTQWRTLTWDLALKFVVACALAGAVILPFTQPYFRVQKEYGFQRELAEVKDLSASPQDYLVAPPDNRLYGALTARWTSPTKWPAEHRLFPGLLAALAGGLGALVTLRTRRPAWLYYAALVIVTGGMSLGPTLQWAGQDTGVPLPYLLLYDHIPGFQGLRAVTRFSILVMLGLAVLAGIGWAMLRRWLQARGWSPVARAGLAAVLVGGVGMEYASFPVPNLAVPVQADIPPVYQWLARQPRTEVMELPATISDLPFYYMYYSTYHWQPIVNGHSGFLPEDYFDLVRLMETFPASPTLDVLRGLGVDLVIVHGAAYPPTQAASIEQALAARTDVALVERFGTDTVYRLLPGRVAVEPPGLRISLPERIGAGETFTLRVSVTNDDAAAIVFQPLDTLEVTAQWSDGAASGPMQQAAAPLPLFVLPDDRRRVEVRLTAPPRPGEYQLNLRLSAPGSVREVQRPIKVLPVG